MSSQFKQYEKNAKFYEKCWERSFNGDSPAETYAAAQRYKENIENQEKELKKMDPNSREYGKAEISIDQQKSKHWEMEYKQRRRYSTQEMTQNVDELRTKNEDISKRMSNAVERGDTKTYDALRTQYDRNIGLQEQMGNHLKTDGVSYKDTVQRQRIDKQNLDIDMRDKLAKKVSQQAEKGKVKQEDKDALEKYSQHVKKDEIENVKKQNQKKIENMQERGASEEEIKYQQAENERIEKWVEGINR